MKVDTRGVPILKPSGSSITIIRIILPRVGGMHLVAHVIETRVENFPIHGLPLTYHSSQLAVIATSTPVYQHGA